jgi:hypothetical protein
MEILLTTSWTKQSKNSASWLGQYLSTVIYLLKEDGGFLLQENGSKLDLEQPLKASWSNQLLNLATWSKQAKN